MAVLTERYGVVLPPLHNSLGTTQSRSLPRISLLIGAGSRAQILQSPLQPAQDPAAICRLDVAAVRTKPWRCLSRESSSSMSSSSNATSLQSSISQQGPSLVPRERERERERESPSLSAVRIHLGLLGLGLARWVPGARCRPDSFERGEEAEAARSLLSLQPLEIVAFSCRE